MLFFHLLLVLLAELLQIESVALARGLNDTLHVLNFLFQDRNSFSLLVMSHLISFTHMFFSLSKLLFRRPDWERNELEWTRFTLTSLAPFPLLLLVLLLQVSVPIFDKLLLSIVVPQGLVVILFLTLQSLLFLESFGHQSLLLVILFLSVNATASTPDDATNALAVPAAALLVVDALAIALLLFS